MHHSNHPVFKDPKQTGPCLQKEDNNADKTLPHTSSFSAAKWAVPQSNWKQRCPSFLKVLPLSQTGGQTPKPPKASRILIDSLNSESIT